MEYRRFRLQKARGRALCFMVFCSRPPRIYLHLLGPVLCGFALRKGPGSCWIYCLTLSTLPGCLCEPGARCIYMAVPHPSDATATARAMPFSLYSLAAVGSSRRVLICFQRAA
ncbi:hypothetical protein OH77DRAFT_199841 [Trametes cingulata]|nr:hypothetical protein OH77DRAFT_199841 [Trametes cingulata]